jgi:hypothetical protein
VDRKGNPDLEPIRIPHPFLAVVGNILPDKLGELADERGRSDGLVERFLFAFPDPRPRPHWTYAGIQEGAATVWAEFVARLRERPMAEADGRPRPRFIPFADGALSEWVNWYNSHIDESNALGFDTREWAADGKLIDSTARFALILHCQHVATDPNRRGTDPPPPVTARAVRGAIALWRYFRSHHRRARWCMDGAVGDPTARDILDWVKRNARESFRLTEVTRNFPRLRNRPDELEAALSWLVGKGAIKQRPDPGRPNGRRGPKPLPTYDVQPSLRAPHNCSNRGVSGSDGKSSK